MADAAGLGPVGGNTVGVQVPSPALFSSGGRRPVPPDVGAAGPDRKNRDLIRPVRADEKLLRGPCALDGRPRRRKAACGPGALGAPISAFILIAWALPMWLRLTLLSAAEPTLLRAPRLPDLSLSRQARAMITELLHAYTTRNYREKQNYRDHGPNKGNRRHTAPLGNSASPVCQLVGTAMPFGEPGATWALTVDRSGRRPGRGR